MLVDMPFSERGIGGCLYGYWLRGLQHIVWCLPASYNLRRATIVCLAYPAPGFRGRGICRGSGEIFCFLDGSMAPRIIKDRWASRYFFFSCDYMDICIFLGDAVYWLYIFVRGVRPVSHYIFYSCVGAEGPLGRVWWSLSMLFGGHDLPWGYRLVALISV